VGTTRSAIIGGTTDNGDPEVFELLIFDVNNQNNGAGCSGTLIADHTILTAAHCVDPRTINATAIDIYVLNATNDQTVGFGDMIHVTKMQYHPSWDPMMLTNDIGLALLAKSPTGVTPKPWNTESIGGLTGDPIRAVGYGASAGGTNPTGGGLKREVPLVFNNIYNDVFELGDGTGHGICHGDSGGPSFYTFPDGVERVVGVHSFTESAACLTGADSRTDYFKSFIDGWLTANEAPTCATDGRCLQGCTPIDQDCACAADGMCTAACLNPAMDPDCPKDCGMNNVCSIQPCPVPDPDCVPNGQPCGTGNHCQTRLCVPDAQHMDPYCTAACTSDADCSGVANMQCNVAGGFCQYIQVADPLALGSPCGAGTACATGTICAGTSLATAYCSTPCPNGQSDCTDGTSTCQANFDGHDKYCAEPAKSVVTLPAMYTAQEAAAQTGCASVAGLLPLLGVLGLLRRRRSA
jgi:hypothetical protein